MSEFTKENRRFVAESAKGKIYAYWDEFRGKRYLHIRMWYLDRKDDEEKPCAKGIAIPEHELPEFVSALKDVIGDE